MSTLNWGGLATLVRPSRYNLYNIFHDLKQKYRTDKNQLYFKYNGEYYNNTTVIAEEYFLHNSHKVIDTDYPLSEDVMDYIKGVILFKENRFILERFLQKVSNEHGLNIAAVSDSEIEFLHQETYVRNTFEKNDQLQESVYTILKESPDIVKAAKYFAVNNLLLD